MKPPDVSVIIVSLNTKDYLARCLAAIPIAAENLAAEVIVVDNGSTDGTQAMLSDEFPHVRLIQNRENLGFGKANNVGAGVSRGRTLLLLNSDCELAPGALKAMVEEMEQDPALGVVFCRLVNPDGSLQPSVHQSFPSPWSLIGNLLLLPSIRFSVYRRPFLHRWFLRSTMNAHRDAHDVAWGGGACLLIRREAFESVRGFDEEFFMYWEDMDLCKRIGGAGYRLRYLPGPSAVHYWGKSTAQVPAAMLRENYRSAGYYFEKHFPGWGGAVACWVGHAELNIRRLFFSLMAVVPWRHRDWFRTRAETGAACLNELHLLKLRAADYPSLYENGAIPLLLTLVILFSAFRYAHDLAKFLVESQFIDFAHYYTYATIVSLGLDPFDPDSVARVDDLLHIRRAGAAANYPPLFYLFMQPWVLLPFHLAKVAWLLFNQACLLVALALCFHRIAAASPVRVTAVLFVWLNYQPLLENVALGQSNIILLLLVTVAWWGLCGGHVWLAASAVAVAFHVKVQYGLLFPLLWWIGYRRACGLAIGLAALGLGAGLLVLGPDHYSQYLRYVLSLPEYLAAWTGNLSPRGVLHRLLGGPAGRPLLADVLTYALDAVLLWLFARSLPRTVPPDSAVFDWCWGLSLAALPLLSPLAEEHHLVVLLLPLTLLLLCDFKAQGGAEPFMLLLGVIILLASRYSLDQFPIFHQGLLSLLMAGKLLGVAGLAWILIHRLRTAEQRG